MSYTIIIKKSVEKELKKLPNHVQKRIENKIEQLKTQPIPQGSTQLTNFEMEGLDYEQLYRLRVGDYRMIYAVEHDIITITVVKVKHRREAYRT